MINIKEKSREFTTVEQYCMTASPEIISMKDVEDGCVIHVNGYLIFEDVKEDGTSVEMLSIIDPGMKAYVAQSDTFRRSFMDIRGIIGDKFPLKKISGVSKGGRPYVNCVLSIEDVQALNGTPE